MSSENDASRIVRELGLAPHPEGGYYRETWREIRSDGARGSGTAIYFLLRAEDRHRWHRIDAAEIWHFYAGAPLELATAVEGRTCETRMLGAALDGRSAPQLVVPPRVWQRARSLGPWTLVGCTVSPAFEFAHFELAPADWSPSAS
ncbi:MAG: cupin domain-containing protein [Planctomycetes bacterium]|nr:cupin domain-containing protein [Planctomycetota bacterium]